MSAARDKKLTTRRKFLGTTVLGGVILSSIPPMLQYLSAAPSEQDSAENDTGFLELRSSFFLAKINSRTGRLEQLTSLSPSPLDLLDPKHPFEFEITTVSGVVCDWNALSIKRTDNGCLIEVGFESSIAENGKSWIIEYSLRDENFEVSVSPLQKDRIAGLYKVRLGVGLYHRLWERQWYPCSPHDISIRAEDVTNDVVWIKEDPRGHARLPEFAGSDGLFVGGLPSGERRVTWNHELKAKRPESVLSGISWSSGLGSPFGVAFRKDRLLAFAVPDCGQGVLFGLENPMTSTGFPNIYRFPSPDVPLQPRAMKLTLRSFTRPRETMAHVMRWFAESARCSNPSSAEAVAAALQFQPQALPSCLGGAASRPDYSIQVASPLMYERNLLESGLKMVWWAGSHDLMKEAYPLTGDAYWTENRFKSTREKFAAEMKRKKKVGLFPLLYRRSWIIKENCQPGALPKEEWILDLGKASIEDLAIEAPTLEADAAEACGHKVLHKLQADGNNPGYREWHERTICRELEDFRPSGIWWDQHDSGSMGLIAIMRNVALWARREYPEMRFLGNEGYASMSSGYCDGIAVESYEVGGKSPLCFEVAKAWNRPVFNLCYSIYYQVREYPLPHGIKYSDQVSTGEHPVFALRYRLVSKNPIPESALIGVRTANWREGEIITLVSLKDLQSDGEWHRYEMHLKDVDWGGGHLSSLALGASSEGGYRHEKVSSGNVKAIFVRLPQIQGQEALVFEIESMEFLHDPGRPKPEAGNILARDGFDHAEHWYGDIPEVQQGSGVFRSSPSGSRCFMKTDLRPWIRAYARGLAAGGFVGVDLCEPYVPALQPLIDFSNLSLALSPICERNTMIADSQDHVLVSGWVGERCMHFAVFNDSDASSAIRLAIDLARLRCLHGFQESNPSIRSALLFDADQGPRPIMLHSTRKAGVELEIVNPLDAQHLLLIMIA